MKISTEIVSLRKYGNDKKIITLLKSCGFDAYDFTLYGQDCRDILIDKDDYKEKAKGIRDHADLINIACNQTHAPFPTRKDNDEPYNDQIKLWLRRAIEVSGILGAEYCVVHPCNDYTPEQNAEVLTELLPIAKENNVKIAIENMWNWDKKLDRAAKAACSHHDDFCRHLELLDKDWFFACLDIGHAEMEGLDTSSVEMIRALGDRLKVLHIHDNDRHYDTHLLPYTSGINLEHMLDALAEIGYDGDITFEAITYLPRIPVELFPQAVTYMAEIGKYMKEQVILRTKK